MSIDRRVYRERELVNAERVVKRMLDLFVAMEELLGWSKHMGIPFRSPAYRWSARRFAGERHPVDADGVFVVVGSDAKVVDSRQKLVSGDIGVWYLRRSGAPRVFWVERVRGRDPLSLVSIGGEGSVAWVYEYPPVSTSSILFFALNPSIEREVRGRYDGVRDGSTEQSETWRFSFESSTAADPPKTIPSHPLFSASSSSLDLEGYPGLSEFVSAGESVVSNPEDGDLERLFFVSLRHGGGDEVTTYETKDVRKFATLVSLLVPAGEISAIERAVDAVSVAVRRVPVIVSALLSLDDEWFKGVWRRG